MPNVTYESIYRAVISNEAGMSLTAISKALGFTRKSSVVEEIANDMLDDGILYVDSDGPFDKYKVVSGISLADVQDNDYCDEDGDNDNDYDECYGDGDCDDEPLVNEPELKEGEHYTIPEDSRGYVIDRSRLGFTVTFPDTGNSHQLAHDERILVINDERRVVVVTPEDLLAELEEFSSAKGYRHYIVKDVATGSALAPNNIDLRPVVIFQVL